jgi:selenocysteine lyase/cysteine desulfurase
MAHQGHDRRDLNGDAVTQTPLPRSQFAVTDRYAYLNHAAVGILPRTTKEAIDRFVAAQADAGVIGVYPYENRMPEFRERIGAFVGAAGDEIAILRNTGDGANAIGGGLDWRAGDEVLLCDDEFPSNALPWLALRERGVNVRLHATARGRLTPDVLRETITSRTRVVTISWVGFADGYRCDLAGLAEVAHSAGAILAVDAIQGLGAFPVDVRTEAIDALYSGGAKWLMALQGVGFLYLAPALRDRLSLAAPGWRSAKDIWDFLNYDQPQAADASRFEGGTPNFLGALSLATSIGVLGDADRAAVAAHVIALTDRLYDGLQRLGAQSATIRGESCSSGIVQFSFRGTDSVSLGRTIQHEEGVVTTWRPSGIRVAPHGYNTIEEIDRLLDALAARVKR